MGDRGWVLALFLITLVNPLVILSGVVSGLLVRRWWAAPLGLAAAPLVYGLHDRLASPEPHASLPIITLAVSGFVWALAAIAVRRAASV